jgi:hypothetical protein
VHDWASHGADAFRYMAVRMKVPPGEAEPAVRYVPRGRWG